MSTHEQFISSLIDTSRPSVPCMYDYYLGGTYNTAVDRQAAEAVIAATPMVPMIARENRRFLRRTVRFMSSQGVKQFLDIGSGLPTVGNTHEVARQVNPGAAVVYVDHEPVVKVLGAAYLTQDSRTAVVVESALHPDRILQHPDVQRLLDFSQPIGLLMFSVLHFIPDDHLPGVLAALYAALPVGSYVAASHAYTPPTDTKWTFTSAESERMKEQYKKASTSVFARSKEGIAELFSIPGGSQIEDPGLVWVPDWRPDDQDPSEEGVDQCFMLGAVARKL